MWGGIVSSFRHKYNLNKSILTLYCLMGLVFDILLTKPCFLWNLKLTPRIDKCFIMHVAAKFTSHIHTIHKES